MGYGAKPCADDRPVARPPGRPPKRHDQRQRILLEAARAFATDGYDNCSLADIAARLDLTRPALYHYFTTKQEIFAEIATTATRGRLDGVLAAVDESQPERLQLEALMLAHAQYVDENYWLVHAAVGGHGGKGLGRAGPIDEVTACAGQYEALLRRILANGMSCGEFRQLDVAETARLVMQLLDITHWFDPGGSRRAVDFAADAYDLLVNGLASGAAARPRARAGRRDRAASPSAGGD